MSPSAWQHSILGDPPIMITGVSQLKVPGLRMPSVTASECVFTKQASEVIHVQVHLFAFL